MIPDCVLPKGEFSWNNCRPAATAGGGAAAIAEPQPVIPRAVGGGSAVPCAVGGGASTASKLDKKVVIMNGPSSAEKERARHALGEKLGSGYLVVVLCPREKQAAERMTLKAFNGFAQQAVGGAKTKANDERKKLVIIIDKEDEANIDDRLYNIRWSDYQQYKFSRDSWDDVETFMRANSLI
jgi:hypothetical protein